MRVELRPHIFYKLPTDGIGIWAIGFFIGAVVGAAVMLLYAPSSGEDLRKNIKTQADAQVARVQNEFQKGLQGVQNRMDKMSSDPQATSSGSKDVGSD